MADQYRLNIRIDLDNDRKFVTIADPELTIKDLKKEIIKDFRKHFAQDAKFYNIDRIENKEHYTLNDAHTLKQVLEPVDSINVVGQFKTKGGVKIGGTTQGKPNTTSNTTSSTTTAKPSTSSNPSNSDSTIKKKVVVKSGENAVKSTDPSAAKKRKHTDDGSSSTPKNTKDSSSTLPTGASTDANKRKKVASSSDSKPAAQTSTTTTPNNNNKKTKTAAPKQGAGDASEEEIMKKISAAAKEKKATESKDSDEPTTSTTSSTDSSSSSKKPQPKKKPQEEQAPSTSASTTSNASENKTKVKSKPAAAATTKSTSEQEKSAEKTGKSEKEKPTKGEKANGISNGATQQEGGATETSTLSKNAAKKAKKNAAKASKVDTEDGSEGKDKENEDINENIPSHPKRLNYIHTDGTPMTEEEKHEIKLARRREREKAARDAARAARLASESEATSTPSSRHRVLKDNEAILSKLLSKNPSELTEQEKKEIRLATRRKREQAVRKAKMDLESDDPTVVAAAKEVLTPKRTKVNSKQEGDDAKMGTDVTYDHRDEPEADSTPSPQLPVVKKPSPSNGPSNIANGTPVRVKIPKFVGKDNDSDNSNSNSDGEDYTTATTLPSDNDTQLDSPINRKTTKKLTFAMDIHHSDSSSSGIDSSDSD